METTKVVSDEVEIKTGTSRIFFLDTVAPSADWTVERAVGKRGDGETRAWVVDSRATSAESAIIVAGSDGYVYQINLGTGNAGPEGAHDAYSNES